MTTIQKELAGTELIQIDFKVVVREGLAVFNENSRTVVVDEYKSSVGPVSGCDIIIDGSSTRSSYIIDLDEVLNFQNLLNRIGVYSLLGYCKPEEYNEVLNRFKLSASRVIELYVERKEQELESLRKLGSNLLSETQL